MINLYSEDVFQFDMDIDTRQAPEVWYPAVLDDTRVKQIISDNLANGWFTKTECASLPRFNLYRFK